jgi:hypothetical protein
MWPEMEDFRMVANRRADALELADELLTDFELNRLRAIALLRKASRLARLLDDAEALDWLTVELSGYEAHTTASGIEPKAWKAAIRSRRTYVDEDGTTRAHVESVSWLEAAVTSSELRMASSADAPQSVSSANPSQFVSSPPGNKFERKVIQDQILQTRPRLDTILGAFHEYVSEKVVELRFGDAVESAFTRLRDRADAGIIGLVPDVARQLTAAFELVSSDNPKHWSDAAGYCRKLIKSVADTLQPPGSDIGGRANGSDNYVNRLVFWIEQRISSGTACDVIVSDLEDFGKRLDAFTDAGNKGIHAEVDRHDADRFIVGTYVLISDVLRLSDDDDSGDEPAESDGPQPESETADEGDSTS